MATCIKVYDDKTGEVEFDCPVRKLHNMITKAHKKFKKKPPLVIGKNPDVFELKVEPILVIPLGRRS